MYSQDQDENEFIKNNQKLVYFTINRYFSNFIGTIDYDDLVQEGLIALLKAYRTFDENKDISFSSYATKCIYNEILQRLNYYNNTELRFSRSFNDKIQLMLKEIKKDDILNYTKEDCKKYRIKYEDFLIYLNNVSRNSNIVSDEDGKQTSVFDFIEEKNPNTDPFEHLVEKDLYERLIEKLHSKKYYYEVFIYSYNCLTQEEIAKKLNLSQNYVSRIRTKIKEMIKNL